MTTKEEKILNKYHVIFLVQSSMIGVGLLTLPQLLSPLGISQAFAPLLFGLIATVIFWMITWLLRRFPNDNIFQINEKLLGKFIGKIVNIFIVVEYLFLIAGIINNYMHLIQSTALPLQTTTAPIFVLLLLLIYIVNGGVLTIARFCILTFFLTIPMIFFLSWGLQQGDMRHLLPLFNFTGPEFYHAFKNGFISMLGFELMMFYFPNIKDQKKAFKHGTIGIWISTIVTFATTATSVVYNSPWQLKHVEFPVLNLFKAGGFSFVERIDIFGITLWLFLILTTVTLYFWSAKKGMECLFLKRQTFYYYLMIIIIFCIIKIPFKRGLQEQIFSITDVLTYTIVIWPVFLCLIYFLRKGGMQS